MILQLLFRIILLSWPMIAKAQELQLAKPGCPSKCGTVTIPFPFGMGEGCYIDPWFDIECNSSSKPFLSYLNLEVLEISLEEASLRVNHEVLYSCKEEDKPNVDLKNTTFVYSETGNRFTALGCNNLAFMWNGDNVFGGCFSTCDAYTTSNSKNKISEENGCYGISCCQARIPSNLQTLNVSVTRINYDNAPADSKNGCKSAFLVDQNWFANNFTNHQMVPKLKQVPVVLDWGISIYSNQTLMNESSKYNFGYKCSSFDTDQFTIVQCIWSKGYEGNPYLSQGC